MILKKVIKKNTNESIIKEFTINKNNLNNNINTNILDFKKDVLNVNSKNIESNIDKNEDNNYEGNK